MPNQDWLSLTRIAGLWSEETGERADALEQDLADWFAEFVERPRPQQPGLSDGDGDTTNLLMGYLGGRHLRRETLAIYCAERGRDMPDFWPEDGGEPEEPEPVPPKDEHCDASDLWLAPEAIEAETPPEEPEAGADPSAGARARPGPDPAWRAAGGGLAAAAGRLLAEFPRPSIAVGLSGRRRLWIAGGLSCAVALVAAGLVFGGGGSGRSEAGRGDVSAAAAATRSAELADARRQIATLSAALKDSQRNTARLDADLLSAKRALAAAQDTPSSGAGKRTLAPDARQDGADREVASLKAALAESRQTIADLDHRAQAAKAEAHRLAAALAQVRRRHLDSPPPDAGRTDSFRQKLILAVEVAKIQAARSEWDLAKASERLARLEAESKAAKTEAADLATELSEMRRRHSVALDTAAARSEAARKDLVLAMQAASADAARFRQNLEAAQRRIQDLESETAAAKAQARSLAQQLADARKTQAAAPDRATDRQSAQPAFHAGSERPAPRPASAATSGPPPTDNSTTPPPAASQATPPPERAAAEAIDVDSLVTDPGRYDARQVVVTGSLLRLLQHYRLQSESGLRTLVVDIGGLHRAEYDELQHATAGAGVIGSVRARISGTVERGSAEAFRLVASEVRLVE